MRPILALILTISLTFVSCQDPSNTYTMEGEAMGFDNGAEILVYSFVNRQPKLIDTLIVNDGKFSATYPNQQNYTLNFLRPKSVNGTIIYFLGDKNLTATLYIDSIQTSRILGGTQNKAYAEFRDGMAKFELRKQESMQKFQEAQASNDSAAIAKLQSDNLNLIEEENAFKREFLDKYKNTLFSIMLLTEMVQQQGITVTEASKYLENIDSKLAESEITQDFKQTLESMRGVDIGVKAPDFSAPTPEGDMLALSDILGKYTIIDFWASWCRPCRVENPNVVRVYNKYHDKGLNIISVSLDQPGQRDKWLQAIEDDKMDWHHVSNLQFWNDPVARQYNIRSIPATFLLDENGVIIDKDLRGAALEAKIASLLGDK